LYLDQWAGSTGPSQLGAFIFIVSAQHVGGTDAGPVERMMDLRERRRDRISFSWRLGVTPSTGEWSAIRLPGPLFPLYRAVRLFRLAAEW